jgi:hypothetical protein
VKEPKTRRVILRSNGDGELYTIPSIAYWHFLTLNKQYQKYWWIK